MRNNRNGLYAIAAAIALVGALALGVPLGTFAFLCGRRGCRVGSGRRRPGDSGQALGDGRLIRLMPM